MIAGRFVCSVLFVSSEQIKIKGIQVSDKV